MRVQKQTTTKTSKLTIFQSNEIKNIGEIKGGIIGNEDLSDF